MASRGSAHAERESVEVHRAARERYGRRALLGSRTSASAFQEVRPVAKQRPRGGARSPGRASRRRRHASRWLIARATTHAVASLPHERGDPAFTPAREGAAPPPRGPGAKIGRSTAPPRAVVARRPPRARKSALPFVTTRRRSFARGGLIVRRRQLGLSAEDTPDAAGADRRTASLGRVHRARAPDHLARGPLTTPPRREVVRRSTSPVGATVGRGAPARPKTVRRQARAHAAAAVVGHRAVQGAQDIIVAQRRVGAGRAPRRPSRRCLPHGRRTGYSRGGERPDRVDLSGERPGRTT